MFRLDFAVGLVAMLTGDGRPPLSRFLVNFLPSRPLKWDFRMTNRRKIAYLVGFAEFSQDFRLGACPVDNFEFAS